MYNERRTRRKSRDICHDIPLWLKNEVSSHSNIGHCTPEQIDFEKNQLMTKKQAKYPKVMISVVYDNCPLVKCAYQKLFFIFHNQHICCGYSKERS